MPIRLLLIDDSKIMRRLVRKELSALFAGKEPEIVECSRAQEALDRCRSEPFDLIFADLTMPEMTGYQLLEKLRELGISNKVIVLTGDIQPDAEKRVREFGAIAFFEKPFDRNAVLAILAERHFL
jgi:two-component system, chemotaxis family, chemotaxis protein CheY